MVVGLDVAEVKRDEFTAAQGAVEAQHKQAPVAGGEQVLVLLAGEGVEQAADLMGKQRVLGLLGGAVDPADPGQGRPYERAGGGGGVPGGLVDGADR